MVADHVLVIVVWRATYKFGQCLQFVIDICYRNLYACTLLACILDIKANT